MNGGRGATEVYVGTSGWLYSWNRGRSLDWYIRHSGLNAVELNSSFYRYPSSRQVESWRRRGSSLRWAVKVHRSITHLHRLNEKALESWRRFHQLFRPMDELIDFYLFQLPPSYAPSETSIERLERLAEETALGQRLAIEYRHLGWLETGLGAETCRRLGATFVSIDSPIGVYIARSNENIYLRMHGRRAWYSHYYSDEELRQDAEKILELKPLRAYVFFNNDHAMLENAQRMKKILEELAA